MLPVRSPVSNAGMKRSLLSDGQLDAGKAANLFSASRRFRALASLALAHSGIVFLLLHLSLLPGIQKAACLQKWQHQVLLQTDMEFCCQGLFLT